MLVAYAHLVHHDPDHLPRATGVQPEALPRADARHLHLDAVWRGRRRCLGASFALLEMKLVIRAMLQHFELELSQARNEKTRRRNITVSPARGCQLILRERVRDAHQELASLSVA